MRKSLLAWLLYFAGFASQAATEGALIVNSSADDVGSCPTTCTLRTAIETLAAGGLGGTITFDPSILPAVINLSNGALDIVDIPMTLQGPGAGLLIIDAGTKSQVFTIDVAGGQLVTLSGMTLLHGEVVGTNGADGTPGTGQVGQPGGTVYGGCIFVQGGGSLTLESMVVRDCTAIGGNGGAGGSGTPAVGLMSGGTGGKGGNGGTAQGGAIANNGVGRLTLISTTVFNGFAAGGSGGNGGDGGASTFLVGQGGNGSDFAGDASGGLIYDAGINFFAYDSTFADGVAQAGNGGNGGKGDLTATTLPGGNGGNGGTVYGGLICVPFEGSGVGYLEFTTTLGANVQAGIRGSGGAGATSGSPGISGGVSGKAILGPTPPANLSLLSSVILGDGTTTNHVCDGNVLAVSGSNNLAEDSTCQATLQGHLASLFLPLSAGALPVYFPLYQSPVIDAAANCNDENGLPVPDDELGTKRPQGLGCDLGAVEADYIFVGTFD